MLLLCTTYRLFQKVIILLVQRKLLVAPPLAPLLPNPRVAVLAAALTVLCVFLVNDEAVDLVLVLLAALLLFAAICAALAALAALGVTLTLGVPFALTLAVTIGITIYKLLLILPETKGMQTQRPQLHDLAQTMQCL
jgi:hypothetical protein